MSHHRIISVGLFLTVISAAGFPGLMISGEAAAPVRKSSAKTASSHRVSTTRSATKAGAAHAPVNARTVPTNPNAFIPYFKSGESLYNAGNYKQAEVALKKSLALCLAVMPPHHENVGIIHNILGLTQMKLKQYPAAIVSLKQAITIFKRPENKADQDRFLTYAYMAMGKMAMYDGRFQEAEVYYRSALPFTEAMADTPRLQDIKRVLLDIGQIEQGPDYLSHVSATVARWSQPDQPILVYIADGGSLPDWRATHIALTQSVFMEWQQAMGTRLRFEFVDSPQWADIQVGWVNRPMENSAEQQANGHAELRNGLCKTQSLNQFWFKNDIDIVTHNTDGTAYSDDVI